MKNYNELIPKISIVTVCKNAELSIEKTIISVINQTYPDIEYIIIDGKSTDKTVDYINKYQSKITYWISENDKGIYDAMNKSLNFINGEWVIFMNAGDTFFDNFVLQNLFYNKYINYILIYGNHSYFRNNKLQLKKPLDLSKTWMRMPVCHQSMFINTKYLKKNPYNINLKYASDYELFYKLFITNNLKIKYFDTTISTVQLNGISESNSTETYEEYKKISLNLEYNYFKEIYFILVIKYRKIIRMIKYFLYV